MGRRLQNRGIVTNDHEMYESIMDERGRKKINHHVVAQLKHPSAEMLRNVRVISHIWQTGDRFWKLAHQYYDGKPDLWWIIAWFNQTPTEHDVMLGQIIDIPLPLDEILVILEV